MNHVPIFDYTPVISRETGATELLNLTGLRSHETLGTTAAHRNPKLLGLGARGQGLRAAGGAGQGRGSAAPSHRAMSFAANLTKIVAGPGEDPWTRSVADGF